jgi:hypothetical protein
MELRTHTEQRPGAGANPAPPGPNEKRFDCFLIDTGWNEPVSKAVRAHLPAYFGAHNPDPLYILTPEQSTELLRLAPELIGHDPTVVVYDHYPPPAGKKRGKYKGFRLNLGLMKSPQQALSRLQEFVRFVIQHRKSLNLEREVVKELHHEGLEGMVKVLREASEASIELI